MPLALVKARVGFQALSFAISCGDVLTVATRHRHEPFEVERELSALAAVTRLTVGGSYDAALDVVALYHIQRNDIGRSFWPNVAQ